MKTVYRQSSFWVLSKRPQLARTRALEALKRAHLPPSCSQWGIRRPLCEPVRWYSTSHPGQGFPDIIKHRSSSATSAEDSVIAQKQKQLRGLYAVGKVGAASIIAKELVDLSLKVYGSEHVVFASSLNNLALMEKENFEFECAIENYSQAIRIYRSLYGYQHNSTVVAMFNLAHTYKMLAETLEQQEDAKDAAASRGSLSKANRIGLYENALDLLKQVLDIRIAQLGESHEDVGMTLQVLGTVLQTVALDNLPLTTRKTSLASLFDSGNPEEYLLKGAKILESHNQTDVDSVKVAMAWNSLGFYYKRDGRINKAIDYYKKALAVLETRLPRHHKNMVLVQNNLAQCYNAIGESAKALKLEQQILDTLDQPSD